MKNINTNSRFAILSEEYGNKNKEPPNIIKNLKNKDFIYKKIDNANANNNNNGFIKPKIKVNNDSVLVAENFPQLLDSMPIKKAGINYTDILEKMKTPNVQELINEEATLYYDNFEHGSMLIKRDSITGQILIKTQYPNYNEGANALHTIENYSEYDILNNLVFLHEKRTSEYIELWGYDEWEKLFIFPHYNYEYFDNLDIETEKNEKIGEHNINFSTDDC